MNVFRKAHILKSGVTRAIKLGSFCGGVYTSHPRMSPLALVLKHPGSFLHIHILNF